MMIQLLRLQSRRIGTAFVLLASTIPVAALAELRAGAEPLTAWPTAFGLAALFFVASVLLVGAAHFVPPLRGWRVWVETGSAAALAVAVLHLLLPALPIWTLPAPVVAVAFLFRTVLYGRLADLTRWRRAQFDVARIRIALPHQMVWRMALPTRPSEHWDPLLRSSHQDEEDADTFHLEYARAGGGVDAVTITMLDIDPNRGYRYLFQGEASGVRDAFAQGDHTVVLSPDGEDATWVELSRRTEDRLPGQILLSWLDNAPEDYARFLRDHALGEEMSGTLAGLHRLAVLRDELNRRQRRRTNAPRQDLRAGLVAGVRHRMAIAARLPSLLSW